MGIQASVGQAFALDGREASAKATRDALRDIDSSSVSIAFVFAALEYDAQAVMVGVLSQLGNTPAIGLSTTGEITKGGSQRRSVTVALLAGKQLKAKSEWEPNSSGEQTIQKLVTALSEGNEKTDLMLVTDGMNGSEDSYFSSLSSIEGNIFGCAASGDIPVGESSQLGGSKFESRGVAGALISGARIGVGSAHGWQPIGASFEVTQTGNNLVKSLDGKPASESYAHLLGYSADDWGNPPLNKLVRLYPLGLERENGSPIQVRTPMWIEADGSLRMNATVRDGAVGHMLVGSREKCVEAAQAAAKEALAGIGGRKPAVALVFVDVSWQILLEGQSGSEVRVVQDVLGVNVPIAGGYTFGQIGRNAYSGEVELLNQHIEVVVFSED